MKRKFINVMCSLALTFVIGASFVGCKDYDDDINSLQKQIDQVASDLASLKSSMGKYVQSVAYNASTGVLTVTGGDGSSASATISQNLPVYTIVANGTTVQLLKDGAKVSEATITVGDSFDPAKLTVKNGKVYYGDTATGLVMPGENSLVAFEDGDGNTLGYTITAGGTSADFYIQDSTPLKSLVFKPVSYLGGVEAMPVVQIWYTALKQDAYPKATKDGEIWALSTAAADIDICMEPLCVAEYHLNPSTVSAAQIKSLSFIADEKDYIRLGLAEEPAPFDAEVDSYSVKDGILSVKFTAKNAHFPYRYLNDKRETKAADRQICVMALQATTQFTSKDNTVESKVITSDYAAVYPDEWDNFALAYTLEAEESDNVNNPTHVVENTLLYGTLISTTTTDKFVASEAIIDIPADFYFNYDSSIDIKDLVKVKYESSITGIENYLTVDELEKYSMSITYSLSDYLGGDNNQTAQNNFATLKGSVLTANVYEGAGTAAIGRQPLVRYELKDDINNKVISVGWVKFLITNNKTVEFTFPTAKFTCKGAEFQVTVKQMNKEVYNVLGLSKGAFDAAYPNVTPEGDGQIDYAPGETTDTESAVITWTLSYDDLDQAKPDKTYEMLVKFTGTNTADQVIVKLSAKVAYPTLGLTGKIDVYWYDTPDANIALQTNNTIKVNVATPVDGNDIDPNNCTIVSNLNAVFVGNKPAFVAGENNGNDFAANKFTHIFNFDALNVYNKDGKTRRVFTGQSGQDYVFELSVRNEVLFAIQWDGKKIVGDYQEVAIIDTLASTIAYQETVYAKDLLNVVSHEKDHEQFFAYINVTGVACDNWLPAETFIAKFLRPINMVGEGDKFLEDAKDGGDTLAISEITNFTDWRDYKFVPDHVNYFGFYNVSTVVMDAANITTNLNGGTLGTTKLSDVTKMIELSQVEPADGKVSYDVDKKTFDCGSIVYKNNGFTVQQFTVRIPFKVTYKWGEFNVYIDVLIKHTINNPTM